MTLYETSFRLEHEGCPFNDLSKKYPGVPFTHWCNNERDILEVQCEDMEIFAKLQSDIENLANCQHMRILHKFFDRKNVQVVIKTCACGLIKGNVSGVIERSNCLEIPPTIYHGGWEYYRVISFQREDGRKLFRALDALGRVEILYNKQISGVAKDTFVISLTNLFGALTEKQVNAIIAALENGYYQIPKRVTAEEIARRYKMSRTTYEEHVRKAESKLLSALAPYVRLFAKTDVAPFSRG